MKWPEAPTCHKVAPVFRIAPIVWTPADEGRAYRHCSYCGSIHPEDLLRLLAGGARLGGSDWKYGWPHKFYLSNPFGKWYNEHLLDEGYDEEALKAILEALEEHCNIAFNIDPEKGLGYQAPYRGYQASGL